MPDSEGGRCVAKVLITTDYLSAGDHVDVRLRRAGHETVHRPSSGNRAPDERTTLLTGFDAAIVASEPVTDEMLASAPSLRIIARSGVGYDSVDVEAATRRGIAVCNAPGINSNAVAEMTFALLLSVARQLPETINAVRGGRWPRHDGRELRGATLGVVGLGPSGRRVIELASVFGMYTVAHTRFPSDEVATCYGTRFVSFEELLEQSDFVSIHTRLDSGNRYLFSDSAFSRMRQTAFLINTARGALIDEQALARALQSREIAGAAIDVLEAEPMAPDHPLRACDNLQVTSHLAGQTTEARAAAGIYAADCVVAALAGARPDGLVNPFAWRGSVA